MDRVTKLRQVEVNQKNQSGFKREVYRKYWNRKGGQRGKGDGWRWRR